MNEGRELGRVASVLVTLLMVPSCLVLALGTVLAVAFLMLVVVAIIAVIPAVVVASKLSRKKGSR